MRTVLRSSVITAFMLALFGFSIWSGARVGESWTFSGVVLSGALWLRASIIPTWVPKAIVAPSVFNSAAAAAAVFAGLTALPMKFLPIALQHA